MGHGPIIGSPSISYWDLFNKRKRWRRRRDRVSDEYVIRKMTVVHKLEPFGTFLHVSSRYKTWAIALSIRKGSWAGVNLARRYLRWRDGQL